MPKVSVIIPAYNAERFLSKCLDSVFQQTLKDLEVILINDGSTDHTQEIIDEYSAAYPEKIKTVTVENGRQGRARNIGIEMSTGDYISFVDADDYIDSDMLQEMYDTAVRKQAELVACDYYLGNEEEGFEYVKPKIPTSRRDMFIDPDVSPCNKLYLASMLRENKQIRFPEKLFYEDIAFYFMYLPYVTKYETISKPFYYYLIHGYSSTHGEQDSRVNDIFPVMNRIVEYFQENGFFEAYRDEVEYAYAKILLCSSMGRICRVRDRKFQKASSRTTLDQLKQHFPEYRKNKYLHGIKGIYMRCVNQHNIMLCAWLMDRLNMHQK